MRLAWLLLAWLGSCGGSTPPRALGTGTRVLFIGNSLTEGHDVPGQVAAISSALGAPLEVSAVVLSGASLEDHWVEGTARRRLASARWDFVVLQQGPTSRLASREALRRDAVRWAELAREAGARTGLYMVWPIQSEPERWDDVRDSYRLAAEDVDGIFLPAGLAWRAAWEIEPSLPLYSPDGLHPTLAGAHAAALVISGGLTGRSPIGAPAPEGLVAATAQTLQQAAAKVLGDPALR